MKQHLDIFYKGDDPNKIGDKIICTEFPENVNELGYKFVNKSKNPFLKYNPFVVDTDEEVTEINFYDLSNNFLNNAYYITARSQLVYKHLHVYQKSPILRSPKFYIYENNEKENIILLHIQGKGIIIPNWIIDHVYSKYNKNFRIIQIVPPNGIYLKEKHWPNIEHKEFDFLNQPWEEVAELASKSMMFVGIDSWVAHMANAYTSHVNLLVPTHHVKTFKNQSRPWGTGATIGNIWFHPNTYYFNETDKDFGYTNSYLTI